MKATIMGAIAGDTIGSVYEFNATKRYDFRLFDPRMEYTDDSIMTIAVAEWILTDPNHSAETLVQIMQKWGNKYPNPMGSYGGGFYHWLFGHDKAPYNSFGNGAAMRVSAVGFAFDTLEETLRVAATSAAVTHSHPEGIKGAQATAAAIFMARNSASKEEIRAYITDRFGYDLSRTCQDIRPAYSFDGTCQGTVPESIIAFLDSKDYEDAIRLTISLGGDADTMGAITGAIAAAYYKEVPDEIYKFSYDTLPNDLRMIVEQFETLY